MSRPVTVASTACGPPAHGEGPSGRRVVVTLVAIQLASCMGSFAVAAHVVAHYRHDLGLLAGTIGLLVAVRTCLQFALVLPVGAVTDMIGARRTGVVACALRAAGFALLGLAGDVGTLLCAAVLIGAGGALYNPAAQSVLAGVEAARRSGGFGAYVAAQHAATVAGPPAGLVLLSMGPGFALLAGAAAASWAAGGVLFLLLPARARRPAPAPGHAVKNMSAVLRDRGFLVFAMTVMPTTLLANAIMTAVPLLGFSSGTATLAFCVLAAVAAGAQPFVAAGQRGRRPWVLRLGLLCAAATFFVLAPLDGRQTAPLILAAMLNGVANGLIQPAIFQRTADLAPAGRFGSYYGVLAFCAGMFAAGADLVIGRLFDLGPAGATAALIGVGVTALVAAARIRDP